jgi:MFS-type transporter involved in bile tolerance (Atg22 family)
VPEPPTATATLGPGENVVSVSFKRLWSTLKDIRQYRELFKFLLSFLIYNDGIGTIIGVAVIYGAELGFGTIELTLALLLVQFVGIPFSIIFGRIPSPQEKRRSIFVAFVVFNMIMLPLVGTLGLKFLSRDLTGARPEAFKSVGEAVGEGIHHVDIEAVKLSGQWDATDISAREISGGDFFMAVNKLFGESVEDVTYVSSDAKGASYDIAFIGQEIKVSYSTGPDHGMWSVAIDDHPYFDDDGNPVIVDGYSLTLRYGVETDTFKADQAGRHTLSLINTGDRNETSSGTVMSIAQVEVLAAIREQNLLLIIGMILGLQLLGVVFAVLLGRPLFSRLANTLDTKRSVMLALVTYSIIAVWGYFLDSTIEFWFLAWMVAIVQGGSQALSRSLYASMSPASKSGEFFGLFGVMEKFSAILGPILFAAAGAAFASSRPAILSLIAFFIVGGFLLTKVDVSEGRRVAQEEDAEFLPSVT